MCSGISHLSCLSSAFLVAPQPSTSTHYSSLIPRGGSCPSCSEYVLWGDIVRGCYRRRSQGATVVSEDEDLDAEASSSASGDNISTGAAKRNPRVLAKTKIGRRREEESMSQFTESSLAQRVSTEVAHANMPIKKIGHHAAKTARKRTIPQAKQKARASKATKVSSQVSADHLPPRANCDTHLSFADDSSI